MKTTQARGIALVLFLAVTACGQSGSSPAGTGGSGGSAGHGGAGGSGGSGGAGGSGVTGGTGGQGGASAGSGGSSAPADDASAGTGGSAMDAAPEDDATPSSDGTAPTSDASVANGPAKIVLVAGGGNGGDGMPATMAKLVQPFGVTVDPMTGDIYISEYGAARVRKIDAQGMISTVAGAGAMGAGGKQTLKNPHDLLFQPHSRILFIADTFGNRVLRMDTSTGDVAPFAGAGTQLAPGISSAYCLAFDATGEHIYITNTGGGKLEVIDLKTMALTEIATPSPRVVALDSKNQIYVVQTNANVIKKLDVMGKAMNLPGMVAAPKRITTDNNDDIIIADTESNAVRKYTVATNKIDLIAGGTGTGTGTLDGDPTKAVLNRPHGVFVDAQGRLLIADSFNNRVLRIEH